MTASAFTLQDRHALVAGVGGALARPAAVALTEAGATVSLLTYADDRTQEVEAQSIANECWSLGRDGAVVRLDSTDPEAVVAAIARVEAQHGPLSVLVTVPQPLAAVSAAEASAEDWRSALAAASGAAVPLLTAGKQMVARGEGRLVSVLIDDTSESAFAAASRAAVLAFTRALGAEWGPRGVLVAPLLVEAAETQSGPHAHAAFRAALRDLVTGAPASIAQIEVQR
jgi:3-oxoacyl-[acyl-carrier protein] reductase